MANKKVFTDESLATLIDETKAYVDSAVSEIQTYTDTEVAKKADKDHNHDSVYYTKEQIDAMELSSVGKNVEGQTFKIVQNGSVVDVIADNGAEIFNDYSGTNKAIGCYSHSEGYASVAIGNYSHSEGIFTTASAACSHAEGNATTSKGDCSHSEGEYTSAVGKCTHAEGYHTVASGQNQHVQGLFNIEDAENKYAHIVGNGTMDEETGEQFYSNAHTLDWEGNAWYAGTIKVGGTSYDNASEVALKSDLDNVGVQSDWSVNDETAVDYIKNKPFYDTRVFDDEETVITFDGNVEGKEQAQVTVILPSADSQLVTFFKISNDVPSEVFLEKKDSVINYVEFSFGEEYHAKINSRELSKIKKGLYYTLHGGCMFATEDVVYENSLITKGTWCLPYWDEQLPDDLYYEYRFVNISGELKKIDEKYLQDAAGKKVTGKTFEIYDNQINKPRNFVAELGAEIFNDYDNNIAVGLYSHAEGIGTIAAAEAQHVQGKYNVVYDDYDGLYAHIVGNGISDTYRSNAHTLDWNGDAWYAGDIYVGGTGQYDTNASKLVTEIDLEELITTDDIDEICGGTL